MSIDDYQDGTTLKEPADSLGGVAGCGNLVSSRFEVSANPVTSPGITSGDQDISLHCKCPVALPGGLYR